MKLPLAIMAAVLSVIFGGHAYAAQPYSAIYVFGDSYCDTGNIYVATGATLPPAPYFEGLFSNGPIWVQQFAASLNLPVAPSFAGGTDYAIGGSRLLPNETNLIADITSIPLQVASYLVTHGGKADPNALYILEGGTNDILQTGSGSPITLGYSIATELAALELQLRGAGAAHFLIVNVVDVGLLPVGRGNQLFNSAAAATASATLAQWVSAASMLQGVQIQTLDMYGFLHGVQASPSHNGFTDVSGSCLSNTNELCTDPAHALFWDIVHPTTAGHALLAAEAEALIHP